MITAKSEITPHKADFLLDLAYSTNAKLNGQAFINKIGLRAQLSFVLKLFGFQWRYNYKQSAIFNDE